MAQKVLKVSVLGGGSFGSALATVAGNCGHKVSHYMRNENDAMVINYTGYAPRYLADLKISENVKASTNIEEVLSGTEMIIHAIPTQQSPDFLKKYGNAVPADVPYVVSSKGFYLKTHQNLSQVLPQYLKGGIDQYAVISGPSFAKELMKKMPTCVTLASQNEELAKHVQVQLTNEKFKIFRSSDVIGVELGGALKNPLSIVVGIAEGKGLGINTIAALVTRSCAELRKIAIAKGAKPETIFGLSGIGDLMLTSFGGLSRNKSVGLRLARGEKIDQIISSMNEVAEGVPTIDVVMKMNEELKLDIPIMQTCYNLIHGIWTVEEGSNYLMQYVVNEEFREQ